MSSKPRSKSKAKTKSKSPKAKTRAKAKTKTRSKAAARPKARAKTKAATKRPAPKRAARPKAKVKRAVAKAAPKPARLSSTPAGYNSVTPYLIAQDAKAAIAYYKEVFGAKEELRMPAPDGKIGHCELKIGDSKIMLADEFPSMNALGPKTVGGSPVTIMVYVKNVDAVVERAVARGGKLLRPVKDQFYGDRSGSFEDPQGHIWHVATHVEDVSAKELHRRSEAAMSEMQSQSASTPKPAPAQPEPAAPESARAALGAMEGGGTSDGGG